MTNRPNRSSRKGKRPAGKKSVRSSPQPPSGSGRRQFRQGEDIRLNKYIARSGVCSRRDADKLIEAGSVSVNGETVREMGVKVRLKDQVEVHGRRIVPEHLVYILLNKPTDTITTTDDEKNRRTVLDLIDQSKVDADGLFPVGRLDRNTTGALLVTNDGELAHRLMHPRYEIDKVYLVTADRSISEADMDALRGGIELDDGSASVDRLLRPEPSRKNVIALSIHEGRNRQVRRMMEAIGYSVEKLDRIRYAGLTTKGIRRGKWRRLSKDEVAALYRKAKL